MHVWTVVWGLIFCPFNQKDAIVEPVGFDSNLLITFQCMMCDGAKSLGPRNKDEKFWISHFLIIKGATIWADLSCMAHHLPNSCSWEACLFACLYGFCTAIQRFARQISTYDNGIVPFSACCRKTRLPKFAVFCFNMKASVKVYQNQDAIHNPFPRTT